jgi:hypothetical protein
MAAFRFRSRGGSVMLASGRMRGRGMVICSSCGATAESPLGWITDVTERGVQHLCDRCSRENLRAIEGRLDPAYW